MDDTKHKPITRDEATQAKAKQPTAKVRTWQDKQTRQAIKEADAGDFATVEEMKSTVRKFVPNA